MNYMTRLINSKCTATTPNEFIIFENLTQTLATRASFYILQCKEMMKDLNFTELQKSNERYAIAVQKMVRTHIQLVMYLMAKEMVDKHRFKDKKVGQVLLLCVRVFAVKQLLNDT